MDAATEDPRGSHARAQSDPHFFRDANLFPSDEEVGGFPTQMGSGRRDARVVCETFGSVRNYSNGAGPKMRQSGSQKGMKTSVRRRSLAYSRNPLLACFVGESVLSSRTIHMPPNCDAPGGSQRTFFSLIPVDRSRVNEKTGEPQSPQLSCIGQVKHRQVKMAKTVEVVTEDLARMDINDGVIPHSTHISKPTSGAKFQKQESFKLHYGESFRLQKEESFRLQFEQSFKLQKVGTFKLRKEESFKVQKEESFKRQKEESFRLHNDVGLKLDNDASFKVDNDVPFKLDKEVAFKFQEKEMPLDLDVDDIPHLDLGGGNVSGDDDTPQLDISGEKYAARLTRCRRVVDEEKKAEDDEKVNSPTQKNSIRYLNHFLKQKFGASMVKSAFVCGWSSGEPSPRSSKSERSESESEHCEIDLSRFASGDFQPKTPSFRDTRYYQHTTGKKLADIRVHSHQQVEGTTDRRWWKEEAEGKEQNDVSVDAVSEETTDFSSIVMKRSHSVILQPATEAALWKRRCMPRPPSLEIQA